jgi:hypothetical protein
VTSADGTTWNVRDFDSTIGTLSSVTFGNDLFVAVSQSGTVLTSPDGANWTHHTPDTVTQLNGVGFGNGLFIAGGIRGRIMTSLNGAVWTSRNSGLGASGALYSFAWGNNRFVAVCLDSNFKYRFMTSPDGAAWTLGDTSTMAGFGVSNVTYSGGLFVAGGGNNTVLTSPDGLTWTSRHTLGIVGHSSATYGAGRFVAVANSGAYATQTTLSLSACLLSKKEAGYRCGSSSRQVRQSMRPGHCRRAAP